MHSRLERWAPLSGIGFVVLWIVGFFVAVSDSPDFAASPAENLEYYVDHKSDVILGVIVSVLALVLLLWFVGCLRAALVGAEGGVARVAATGFAGGIIGVGLLMASMGMFVMPALRLDERDKLTVESATTFMDLGNITYGLAAPLGFGVLFFAIALLGFRAAAVPKWWAVITGLLGIVMIVPFVSWSIGFVLPIWVIVMVILLMRADREATPSAA
jgi:hypothetical protein